MINDLHRSLFPFFIQTNFQFNILVSLYFMDWIHASSSIFLKNRQWNFFGRVKNFFCFTVYLEEIIPFIGLSIYVIDSGMVSINTKLNERKWILITGRNWMSKKAWPWFVIFSGSALFFSFLYYFMELN